MSAYKTIDLEYALTVWVRWVNEGNDINLAPRQSIFQSILRTSQREKPTRIGKKRIVDIGNDGKVVVIRTDIPKDYMHIPARANRHAYAPIKYNTPNEDLAELIDAGLCNVKDRLNAKCNRIKGYGGACVAAICYRYGARAKHFGVERITDTMHYAARITGTAQSTLYRRAEEAKRMLADYLQEIGYFVENT